MPSINFYASFVDDVTSGNVDWDNDDINVALLTSSYTPDTASHAAFSDVSGDEASGTGYTAGGVTLANKSTNDTGSAWQFDADDAEWPSSTITARYGVIYDATASGSPLLAYVDFDSERESNSGMFRIAWNASGIFEVQY